MLAVALLGMAGCGGEKRPDGFPRLYPLTIHVTQEGKPLEGATIALVTPDGTVPWAVAGTTDAEGNAKMMTQGKYPGAPEGKFNVQILKTVYEGQQEYLDVLNAEGPAAAQRVEVNVFQYVEDAYTSITNTPVKVEVTKSTKILEVDAGPAVKIQKPFMR